MLKPDVNERHQPPAKNKVPQDSQVNSGGHQLGHWFGANSSRVAALLAFMMMALAVRASH